MGKFKDAISLGLEAVEGLSRNQTPANVEALVNALSVAEGRFDKKLDAFFALVDEVKSLANRQPDSPQKTRYVEGLDAILDAVGALERAKGYLHKAPYLYFNHSDIVKALPKPSPMLEAMEAMEREKSKVVGPVVVEVVGHDPV